MMPTADDRVFKFGVFVLDLKRGHLRDQDGEIALRPKSFEVLRYLVEHAGRLILKQEIIQAVWPDVAVTDGSLTQCVRDVRVALRDDGQEIIRTVSRRGYLFDAAVATAAPDSLRRAAPVRRADVAPAPRTRDMRDPDAVARGLVAEADQPLPAERRQLTVLACEWLGLAARAARLDPEDLHAEVAARHRRCREIVERYHGHVARALDHEVLVYFGHPVASEHDAERAVSAGLELLARAAETPAGPTGNALSSDPVDGSDAPLPLRIGVASGLVVTFDRTEGGTPQRAAMGAPLHLARHLAAGAEPGRLLIDQTTHRLIGGLFAYDHSSPLPLDGGSAGLQAWRVLGPGRVESRFEALRADRRTALVGREEETDLLLRRWPRAKGADGRVVLIGGEPGIGKSRLAAALLDRVAAEPHARLRFFCSPHHSGSALHPIIQGLERAAGFAPDDEASAKRDRLDALLARTSTPSEDRAVLADLLSVPRDGRYPVLDFTPVERRRRTIDAMTRWLEAKAREQPVIVIFEDVHWIDPTSLDVLAAIVDRIARLRVLLMISFRPDFAPPWVGAPHVTMLTLGRLAPRESRDLIAQVAGEEPLPGTAVDEIVRRSDGVPLFVEELTKAVVGTVSGKSTTAAAADLIRTATDVDSVPATLSASLTARLDQLGGAREVAQIGAVIGREFSYPLLAAVAGRSDADLADALDRLADAGLVRADGAPPHAILLFKHALIQDAAYAMLPREARRDLHARIARAIDESFPQIRDAEPELLAHHYFAAEMLPPAIACWTRAGQAALGRAAFAEAVAHLGRAIEIADRAAQAGTPATSASVRLALQTAYGQALLWARGYGAPETIAAFTRAKELAAAVEGASERCAAYYGLCAGSLLRGELAAAREHAEAFLHEVQARPASVEAALARDALGVTAWYQGDFAGARMQYEQALACRDAEEDRDAVARFGLDPFPAAMVDLAVALWPLGEADRARRLAEDAIALAAAAQQVPTLVYVHSHKLVFEMLRRDARRALPHAQAVMHLARGHGLTLHLAYTRVYLGWIRWQLGERQEGPAEMRDAIERLREHGVRLVLPWCVAMLAELEMAAGEPASALATVEAALAEGRLTGEHWHDAESHRLRGMMLARHDPPDIAAAEHALRAAIAIAQRQSAPTFALRAALSLAELQRATGRGGDARNVLAAAVDALPPTRELPEIDAARTLLAALASAANAASPPPQ